MDGEDERTPSGERARDETVVERQEREVVREGGEVVRERETHVTIEERGEKGDKALPGAPASPGAAEMSERETDEPTVRNPGPPDE